MQPDRKGRLLSRNTIRLVSRLLKGILKSGDNGIIYFQGTGEKITVHLEFYTLTNPTKSKRNKE